MRAERVLSRGGSEIFFNLGEEWNHFFPNITIVFPILIDFMVGTKVVLQLHDIYSKSSS